MKNSKFYPLKIVKKKQLTKSSFALELEIPEEWKAVFHYHSGQFVTLQWQFGEQKIERDFSMTSTPHEEFLSLGIKIHGEETATAHLYKNYQIGDELLVSPPQGRFILASKPDEFRTILLFAAGIGITPILSHLKNILHTEFRTRVFLFYGNTTKENIAFHDEIEQLKTRYAERLEVHYFLSQEATQPLYQGRMDKKKISLIINQFLTLDDTDEESTIWDAVDEVLICGPAGMVKEVANACYENGIRKENIHFEFFESYHESIYPIEVEVPLIQSIAVDYSYLGKNKSVHLADNSSRLLQMLLEKGEEVPYSCKSGICGTCMATLITGEVEQLENEFLTEKEEKEGKILPCMCIVKSKKIEIAF
ncbi:ferredoxin--NADP reductase [Bergeyella zoohelcum]|uniref:ferredoxin--NADP reductase n=1 Tax=Bergeyella zoohelcum TaxID=1015 RepID=UPI002A914ECD|nr:ferredoxin--NADP reductase [Bergeyella zoohelcum]MDY6026658.1 ferredoxin--NADP reductase [Bergeyella zoohelcum]